MLKLFTFYLKASYHPSFYRFFFHLVGALSLCFALTAQAQAQARPLISYHSGDWSKLLAQTKNHASIIHIWGFSCGPCVEELPAWGDFAAKHPKARLIMLEVDQVPEEMILSTLKNAKLMTIDNYVTAEYFDDYMRYEVDPKWMGELPITLLIDAKGSIKRLRGSVDFTAIKNWADQNE